MNLTTTLIRWLAATLVSVPLSAQVEAGPPVGPDRGAQEADRDAQEVDEGSLPLEFGVVEGLGLRYHVTEVPTSAHVAVVLGFGVGVEHDPAATPGLTRAAADALRLHFEQPDLAPLRLGVRVARRTTFVTCVVETAQLDRLQPLLQQMVEGTLGLEDDVLQRAIARTRLRADDETTVLPGPILAARARAQLLAGTPGARPDAGSPDALDAVDPAALRRWLGGAFTSDRAFLVAVGGVNEADSAALFAGWRWQGEAERIEDLAPVTAAAAQPAAAHTEHHLVDAPFVTAALPVPSWGEPRFLESWIVLDAIRARAARVFLRYRGGEAQARFPFVGFDDLDAPPLMLINRRGETKNDIDQVMAEVRGLLADLREHGLVMQEVGQSTRRIAAGFAVPPFEAARMQSLAENPRLLLSRAYVIAAYHVNEWPRGLSALVLQASLRNVQLQTRELLAKDRVQVFSLRPTGASAPTAGTNGDSQRGR